MILEDIILDNLEDCMEEYFNFYAIGLDDNFDPESFLHERTVIFDGKPLNEVEKCEWILRWLSNQYEDMIEYLTKRVVVNSLEKNNVVQNELCRLDRVYSRNEKFFIEYIRSHEKDLYINNMWKQMRKEYSNHISI